MTDKPTKKPAAAKTPAKRKAAPKKAKRKKAASKKPAPESAPEPAPRAITWEQLEGEGFRLVTKRELAVLFQRTPRTIDNWILDGLPVAEGGGKGSVHKFDPQAAREWFKSHFGHAIEEEHTLEYQKMRESRARADKIERENAVEEGRLVDASEVARAVADPLASLQNDLIYLPTKLPGLNREQRADAKRRIRKALDQCVSRIRERLAEHMQQDHDDAG